MKIRLYKKGLLEQKFRKNSKDKLKYKVVLMSYREMELLNNFDARKTGQ